MANAGDRFIREYSTIQTNYHTSSMMSSSLMSRSNMTYPTFDEAWKASMSPEAYRERFYATKALTEKEEALLHLSNERRRMELEELDQQKNELKDKYFAYDNDCRRHDKHRCPVCLARMEKEEALLQEKEMARLRKERLAAEGPKSIALVPLDVDGSSDAMCEKAKTVESFEKQIQVIQTVEGLSEDDLNKIKVKDLPKRAKQATDNMTVGHLKRLVNKPGWLDKIMCKLS